MQDRAKQLKKYTKAYTTEQIRILLTLVEHDCMVNDTSPYDSKGMTRTQLHWAVHPWAAGNSKIRWNQKWAKDLDSLIAQKVIIALVCSDEDIHCITYRGIKILHMLTKDMQNNHKKTVKG